MEDLLTPKEAADILRMPKSTLDQWRYRCVGPSYIKANGLVRYRRTDIDQWISDRLVVPFDNARRDAKEATRAARAS